MEKITVFIACLSLSIGLSSAIAQNILQLNYLNHIRQQAGLSPFVSNSTLDKAAQNHANYLSFHQLQGHLEQSDLPLFTGKLAPQRVIHVGYDHQQISENVTSTSGNANNFHPIDQLMSAIYHRFAFLTTTKNEVGIGQQLGDLNAFVYVMGNSNISALCQMQNFKGNGHYVYKICADPQHKIEQTLFKQTLVQQQLKQPLIITWPAANSQHIPPVFYKESPDPLPHVSVSGYPISVEFNSAFFKRPPQLDSFKLTHLTTGLPINNTLLLNHTTDPNQTLNAYQHALFPLYRLDWNTSYQVDIRYSDIDTKATHTINWIFSTSNPKLPIFTVKAHQSSLTVPLQQEFLLYFPPRHQNDINTTLSYRDLGTDLTIDYYDKNTLKIKALNSGKAELIFHQQHITLKGL